MSTTESTRNATTTEAAQLARALFREHGLVGWSFQFDRGKRKMGTCYPLRKLITVSEHLVRLNTLDRVRQTILHELAHALDWERNGKIGHGPTWKAIARSLGHSGQRTYSSAETVTVKALWRLVCPGCGASTPRHRRPSRVLGACKKCCRVHNGGRYDARFQLRLERNR